uniref:CSON011375 protein n=1 Tax=Culicoides sonorensis TaxID=179676 RepID=A0A336M3D3_CULSO
MSENISETDLQTKSDTETNAAEPQNESVTLNIEENKSTDECLTEPQIQSEIPENSSADKNSCENSTTEIENKEEEISVESKGDEDENNESNSKSAEIPSTDINDAPLPETVESVTEQLNNGLEDEELVKSDSDHDGEIEELEEPEECDNELIITGDDKVPDLIDSETSHHKKNRRRILVDESDESDAELERDEILRSCTPDNVKQEMSRDNSEEEEEIPSEKEEKDEESAVEMDPEICEIIAKEKPGPKSKKSSTYLKLEQEYETRHLFKNAIIIPAVEKKKKPKRVLASEDEESDEKSREPDVFGIGLEEENVDDEMSRLSGTNILISENLAIDPNFIPLEGIEVDAIPQIIPLDNPILPQEEETPPDPVAEPPKIKQEILTQQDIKPNVAQLQQEHFTNPDKSPEYGSLAPVAPVAQANVTEFSMEDHSGTPTVLTDLSDNKAPQVLVIKKEKEPDLDQKTSEQFLADALRAQFTDQAPSSIKKLEENTELSMNTTFWGRDSSSSSEEDDEWANSMFVNESKSNKSKKSYKYSPYGSNLSGKKRKRDKYQSTSESESSSDERNRRKKKNSNSRSVNTKKTIYLHKQNQTLRTAIKGYSKKDIKKKVKDRFFDRSLLVPNDIYFGDTKVPDHLLHAYNSDALTSSDSDDGWFNQVLPPMKSKNTSQYKNKTTYKTANKSKYTGTMSPSGDAMIQTMKNYLKAAGIKKIKFSKLWEGCKSNAERASAMLRLLREKGLVGEPTMAKCRELKKKMQAKREIDELDTSVIIDSDSEEEGQRRIHTRRTTRKTYCEEETEKPVIPPEAVHTLNKLKKVIDSDSE